MKVKDCKIENINPGMHWSNSKDWVQDYESVLAEITGVDDIYVYYKFKKHHYEKIVKSQQIFKFKHSDFSAEELIVSIEGLEL